MGHRVDSGLPGSQWEEGKKINFKTHSAFQGSTNTQLRRHIGIAGSDAREKFLWWIVKDLDCFWVREEVSGVSRICSGSHETRFWSQFHV